MSVNRSRSRDSFEPGQSEARSEGYICGCCPICPPTILFLGFIGFYALSFLWDMFVLYGGWKTLALSQASSCVDRAGFENLTPTLIVVLLFVVIFHAIALIWIIGFVHWKSVSNNCFSPEYWTNGHVVDVPESYCHPTLYIPFCCFDILTIIQFGLSFYVYLFLEDLMEDEPETYVDNFCVSFEDAEEAFEMTQLSLFFFLGVIIMGCVYSCFIMMATNDRSMLREGRQRITSPILSPRVRSP
mmetsp:Transcript_22745/g.36521  ORF Transcript_22745/g.36521 Transcript_22745/m.36521 type:complete len:243 (-) Transcript_22745:17-745(-)|eukprot:CAMPEP_0202700724 /NCGR_PEP_ID=MMETSP1385-20130828/13896_1 /ASSEMBLY_ACC=CAM_ASM_000861 /TAXON_ID=933848 /ORGANISM="Elphidium margaritaceum" /LENGTH=242 /DNA_ID=CAMNT_0049357977 /DNA_START=111 /DNA_END=839 /DNA_ORIENTATION=-